MNMGMSRPRQATQVSVYEHFPADMSTGISTNVPLTVEFKGDISESFYDSVNLDLFSGMEPVNGDIYYNPSARQIMFKTSRDLSVGTTYTARLTYNDGTGRPAQKIWSFQTARNASPMSQSTERNYEQPMASSNNSERGGGLMIVNSSLTSGRITEQTPIEVTFSEPIDISTLRSAPVKLFENNTPVGVDYRVSRDMRTLTISSRNSFKANAEYALAIDRSLASNSGKRLDKKVVIPFELGNNSDFQIADYIIEETVPDRTRRNQNSHRSNQAQITNQSASTVRQQTTQRSNASQTVGRIRQQPTGPAVQITGLSPINGQRVTNLTQPVSIAFSDEINPQTLNEFTFRLEDDFGPVPADIHYFEGHKQATLTPIGTLDNNKNYRIVVTQGVSDQHGRPIKTGITSMFATNNRANEVPAPQMFTERNTNDDIRELQALDSRHQSSNNFQQVQQKQQAQQRPTNSFHQDLSHNRVPVNRNRNQHRNSPEVFDKVATANKNVEVRTPAQPFRITSIYPGANSDNIARRSQIAVHFSEPVDPSTINNVNISIFGNQRRVNGRVIWDNDNNRAIFIPSHQLQASTNYRVLVSDNIKSRSGEKLSSRFSWKFSTGNQTRTAQNNSSHRNNIEANAAFFIPLEDGKRDNRQNSNQTSKTSQSVLSSHGRLSNSTPFSFVSEDHWSFRSMRHLTNKGILNNFPFTFTSNVTRYEFANAVTSALNNLRSMQHSHDRPSLNTRDLIELEKLIIEYRTELRSYGVNTSWFENFLMRQGIDIREIEQLVQKKNAG